MLGSGSGHPSLLGPLRPGALLHWPVAGSWTAGSTAQGWHCKHWPGGYCGSSWSDLRLSPLDPQGLKRTLPPGADSGIRSTPPFLRTAYLTCHLTFPRKVRQDVEFGRSSSELNGTSEDGSSGLSLYSFKSRCGKEPEGFLGPGIKIDARGRPAALQPISLVGGIGQEGWRGYETGDAS